MKAVVARSFGPIEALEIAELPDPVTGPGQAVIDVIAAGVNYPDLLVVGGKYQILPSPPFTPGKEAVGIVSAVGAGVDTCRIGDRVMALVEHGAYCQRLVAPAANVFVLPDGMDWVEAAGFGLTLQTAYFALVVRGDLKAGETVLVTGAAGGVGLACVQLAHALGAKVIAGVSSPEKADVARNAGAGHVIYLTGDNLRNRIREDVRALTDGKGADVICEVVGGDVFDGCLRALAWSGRLVVLGFAGGRIPSIPANYVLLKNIAVTGLHWSDYREWHPDWMRRGHEVLFDLYRKGLLSQKVTVTYPLAQVVEAMRQLRDRLVKGKVVLMMKE